MIYDFSPSINPGKSAGLFADEEERILTSARARTRAGSSEVDLPGEIPVPVALTKYALGGVNDRTIFIASRGGISAFDVSLCEAR